MPVSLLPLALLLFPTGHLPSQRWRPALGLAIAGVSVPAFFLAIASAVEPDPLGVFGAPAGPRVDGLLIAVRIGAVIAALALLLAVLSLLQRLRRGSADERRQVLCLALGGMVLACGIALAYAGLSAAWVVGAAALPVAAGVAILWHRLYDLDLFINRSLVYFTLSTTLLVAFGAIVTLGNALAGRLLPEGTLTVIAVALAALGLDPLRRRLQRGVDRLLYGSRGDPYAVVTALGRGHGRGRRLAGDARGRRRDRGAQPRAAVRRDRGGRRQRAPSAGAEWGRCHGRPISLPLTVPRRADRAASRDAAHGRWRAVRDPTGGCWRTSRIRWR